MGMGDYIFNTDEWGVGHNISPSAEWKRGRYSYQCDMGAGQYIATCAELEWDNIFLPVRNGRAGSVNHALTSAGSGFETIVLTILY
jgi:hypothetical protein